MAVTGDESDTGTASDLSAHHLRNPATSSFCQSEEGTSAHDSKHLTEDAIHKRAIRLMKNREAARECRRKKKEYVRCLETRVALLEDQNKALMDELRNLKLLYRHH
ncbi:cAMP-responsive element modulator-like [Periophthalmus magnuspinnatus]|uniref:cAMP-responsive element modulator-like n=1 Tax=Periophthalmus magnuspinnatus TaxID=409849 RepID=UPI00145ABBB5|nr:cAMP-responsive element modulator-like [Periophthalmus magnuspinnatus]